MPQFKRPGEGHGPPNYSRSGLKNEDIYRAMGDGEWMTLIQITGHVAWIPSPEFIGRIGMARNKKVPDSPLGAKLEGVRSRLNCMLHADRPKVERRIINETIEWRLTEHGKARIATIEDQARRKHATEGRTRRVADSRLSGSISERSGNAAAPSDV